MKTTIWVFAVLSLVLFSCEKEGGQAVCNGGLRGAMFRNTALKDFSVCGYFRLATDPDITAIVNGETRVIGKKYVFENQGEPFESVYYLKGEVAIYRKDSGEYNISPFNFTYSQLAIPLSNTFEDGEVVVELVFSHDKNNPSHQGPVQYIDWIDWKMHFDKGEATDKVTGWFKTADGMFWIPGPASNSYAALDIQFELQ